MAPEGRQESEAPETAWRRLPLTAQGRGFGLRLGTCGAGRRSGRSGRRPRRRSKPRRRAR